MKNIMMFLVAVVFLLGAAWKTAQLHGFPRFGIDDANIFFSYAENMANSKGITYANNAERVEGFTSMLWMLISASQFRLGVGESGVLALSILMLLFTQFIYLGIIHKTTRASNRSALPYHVFYLLLVLSSPAYFYWMTITLMDTCLWGFIIACMTWYALFPPASAAGMFWMAVSFFLAPLSRPEFMLAGPAFAGLMCVRSRTLQGNWLTAWRLALLSGTAFLASLCGLTMFRLHYFGYPLPNTYYAKVSPSLEYNLLHGLRYFMKFVISGPIAAGSVLLVAFIVAFWTWRLASNLLSSRSFKSWWSIPWPLLVFPALASGILLLIPVLVGGDHFYLSRFYQPAFPVLCLSVVLAVRDKSDLRVHLQSIPRPLRWAAAAFLALLCFGWLGTYIHHYPHIREIGLSWFHPTDESAAEFWLAEKGMEDGRKLNHLFREYGRFPSIGVVAAGGRARTYSGPVIDTLGLNNSTIAHYKGERKGRRNHAAFEKEPFFQLAPEVFITRPPVFPDVDDDNNQMFKGVFFDHRFTDNWRYGTLSCDSADRTWFTAFFHRRLLESILQDSQYHFHDTLIWTGVHWREADTAS